MVAGLLADYRRWLLDDFNSGLFGSFWILVLYWMIQILSDSGCFNVDLT